MPIHDWSKMPSGLFHHFHQGWAFMIARALNDGRLPKGLTALVEQRSGPKETDVLAVERKSKPKPRWGDDSGGLMTATRPVTRIIRQTESQLYAKRASRVAIRHYLGEIVAVIEIVSPGNRDSRAALKEFVTKSAAFIQEGIHLLVIDLYPPSPLLPFGIHKAIWDEIDEEDFAFPPGKNLILASYETDALMTAQFEPVAVGDLLPDMPLFLGDGMHVPVPLEAANAATWEASGEVFRETAETGKLPDGEDG